MDTSYTVIKSLIELIVKKSGFDINNDYSEEELKKTNETIKKLESESHLSDNNRKILLTNLKHRKLKWENNAANIGKLLLKSYEDKKPFEEVQDKVVYLCKLAKKGEEVTNNKSLMNYVYGRIDLLEKEYTSIIKHIKDTDYVNYEEKNLDSKLRDALNSRLSSHKEKLNLIELELARLIKIENSENLVNDKVNKYIAKIKKNIQDLEELKMNSIEKEISLDVWEKIETIELNIKDKLEQTLSIVNETKETSENITSKREELLKQQQRYKEDLEKIQQKLEEVEERIAQDDYIDYYNKIADIDKKELIRLELSEFNNKKEVIYIDIDKIYEELKKEWGKIENNTIKEIKIDVHPKKIEKETLKELNIIKKEKPKEIYNNKIELDW